MAQREQQIIRSFIGLTDRLVDDFDLLDLTIQLTEDCARLLDVAAAGLLLADAGGALHVLAATSERARSLEVFQLQREPGLLSNRRAPQRRRPERRGAPLAAVRRDRGRGGARLGTRDPHALAR